MEYTIYKKIYDRFIRLRYPLIFIILFIKNKINIRKNIIKQRTLNKIKFFNKNRFDKKIKPIIIDLSKDDTLIDLTNDSCNEYDADTDTKDDVIEVCKSTRIKTNIYDFKIPKDFIFPMSNYGLFYAIIFFSNCANNWLLKFGVVHNRSVKLRFNEHIKNYDIIQKYDFPKVITMLIAKYPNVRMLEDKVKNIVNIDNITGKNGILHREQTLDLKMINNINELISKDTDLLELLNFNKFYINDLNEIIKV